MKKKIKGVLFENLVSFVIPKDSYLNVKYYQIHFLKNTYCSVVNFSLRELRAINTVFEDYRTLW